MKNAFFSMILTLVLALAATRVAAQSATLTAGEVINRIKQHVTCEWNDKTVDTYKAGNEDMPVTGIVTTFTATMEVLEAAVARHCNMIITHEPTFYNHIDEIKTLSGDAVLEAKRKYIREHQLIIFRFHDHWHRTMPDGIYEGVIDRLGWEGHKIDGKSMVFEFEPASLRSLADKLKARFPSAEIRIVGNPELTFTHVGLSLGAAGSADQIHLLERKDVQVLIAGESREWETVEYARDAVLQGRTKACIWLGHAVSEEPGMKYCAQWLQDFISEVPIHFVKAGDPYWAP